MLSKLKQSFRQKFMGLWNDKSGFSLIELLVSVAIMILLVSGAIAGYLTFDEKQTVLEATNQLKSYIARAQNQAKTGNLDGCPAGDTLEGYNLTTSSGSSPTEVRVIAVCLVGSPLPADVYYLPAGVDLNPDIDITFKVLYGGVIGADSGLDITLMGSRRLYLFTLTESGEVSEGGWI